MFIHNSLKTLGLTIILILCNSYSPISCQVTDSNFSAETFDRDTCLSPKTDFVKLRLQDLVTGSDKIKLQIRNDSIIDELDLTSLKNFDIKNWILFNQSFENNDTLVVKNYATEKIFCLKAKEVIPKSRGEALTNKGFVKFPVFFATDRNYIKKNEINERFGTSRSELKYGLCEISIPNTHTPGEIEEPSLWKLEFEEDPKEHIVIHTMNILPKNSFIKSLNKQLSNSEKKTSFLFVHGYNVSFSEAAKRTAQISYDLLFKGVPVFYSWPSKASLSGYTNDEANIRWAQANIKNFLKEYLSKSDAEEVYLIAHSMGTRGLTNAILELLNESPELKDKIKEVILAAPDIDADIFKRDIAPKMTRLMNNPITLYVSENDMALKASKIAHGYPRAGDVSDGLILINGIETIDASDIETSLLGHSYFADSTSLISDIFDLLKTGRRAQKRKNLMQILKINTNYWKFRSN